MPRASCSGRRWTSPGTIRRGTAGPRLGPSRSSRRCCPARRLRRRCSGPARKRFAECEAGLFETALEPGSRADVLLVSTLMALADGDRDRALSSALETVETEGQRGLVLWQAGAIWFVVRMFGPDAAGGSEA